MSGRSGHQAVDFWLAGWIVSPVGCPPV